MADSNITRRALSDAAADLTPELTVGLPGMEIIPTHSSSTSPKGVYQRSYYA